MHRPLRILVLEDVTADFLLLERHLRQQGIAAACKRVESDAELDAALQSEWDVLLSDYNLPGMDFRATLRHLQDIRPDLPVILVSGSVGEETAVELLRLGLSDFILKDSLARLMPAIRRALEAAEERRARRIAEVALRENQVVALEEQRQARLAALNLMEDAIAARNQAEAANAALRESEQRFRGFIENASDIVYGLTPEGTFTYLSPNWLELMGEPAGTAVGKSFERYVHPEDVPLYRAFLERIRHTGEKFVIVDYRALHRDGSIHWHAAKGSALRDRDGNVVGYQGIARDITERKQNELSLARERGFLKTLIQALPDLVWLKDTAGVYLACNPRFERLYGFKEADIVGKTDHDFVDRELADSFRANDRAVIAAGIPSIDDEERIFADDGHREWLQTIKTPMFDAGGNLMGVLGIARDITATRQAQETLRTQGKMLTESQRIAHIGSWEADLPIEVIVWTESL